MDDKHLSPKKRYTQHYRKKWEDIPQLRGWLSMFPHKNPERTKAFCKYCQRKLVPHVTGLLKHAACRAHLKASRAYMDRIREGIRRAEDKAKQQTSIKETSSTSSPRVIVPSTSTDPEVTETEDGVPKITVLVQDVQDDPDDNLDMDRDMDDDDDDDNRMSDNEHTTIIQDPLSQEVKIRVVMDDALLSTSIVDTTKGLPVVGLGVSLYQLKDGRWTLISDSVSDAEGRCSDLLKDNSITLHAGRFKMHYDVSQYYAIRNQECFFPFIEVVFDISNPQEKYSIPLLLSPYSYSTYKGT